MRTLSLSLFVRLSVCVSLCVSLSPYLSYRLILQLVIFALTAWHSYLWFSGQGVKLAVERSPVRPAAVPFSCDSGQVVHAHAFCCQVSDAFRQGLFQSVLQWGIAVVLHLFWRDPSNFNLCESFVVSQRAKIRLKFSPRNSQFTWAQPSYLTIE